MMNITKPSDFKDKHYIIPEGHPDYMEMKAGDFRKVIKMNEKKLQILRITFNRIKQKGLVPVSGCRLLPGKASEILFGSV